MATWNRLAEGSSAIGERTKGAVKDAAVEVTDNRSLGSEGEREDRAGGDLTRQPMSPMKLFSQGMLGRLGAKDETRQRYFSDETATDSGLGSKAMERAGVGSAIGVAAGAILATLAPMGTSIVIPGPGVVVAGPIATVFAGADWPAESSAR